MNLTMMRRGAEYVLKLCLFGSSKPEQIDFYPQKLRSVTDFDPPPMPELTAPESVGVESGHIRRFLQTLEDDPTAQVHNLLIYRHGKLISAASAPGYSPRLCSMTFSMAKTVTSFAVGCLIGEGRLRLDTRLVDVFPDDLPLLVSARTKKITVRHLLTMTAGVAGVHELAIPTLTEWKRAFLAASPSMAPGSKFFYNSLNSYMLAAIVEKISGRSMEDYLREHLFEPLGITNYEIERSPEGIAKGGWGMYLTPLDMGKLGLLMLAGGVWEGKRILPADYVRQATCAAAETPAEMGDYNYGFHMWVARNNSAVLFHGMLGQQVWICPGTDMVVVATCGNNELYQESNVIHMIDGFFGKGYHPAEHLHRAPFEASKLRHAEQAFFAVRHGMPKMTHHTDYFNTVRERDVPGEVSEIVGEYEFDTSNVGLLPIYWRAIQNNHNPGISRVAFRVRDKHLYIAITEGTEREMACGFRTYAYTVLGYRGERYLVGARGSFFESNEGERVFRLDIVFPELPMSRCMKFCFRKNGDLTVACSEIPAGDMLYAVVDGVDANIPWLSTVFGIIRARMGDTAPQALIARNMAPVLHAKRYERAGTPPAVGDGKRSIFYRMLPRKVRRWKLPRLFQKSPGKQKKKK